MAGTEGGGSGNGGAERVCICSRVEEAGSAHWSCSYHATDSVTSPHGKGLAQKMQCSPEALSTPGRSISRDEASRPCRVALRPRAARPQCRRTGPRARLEHTRLRAGPGWLRQGHLCPDRGFFQPSQHLLSTWQGLGPVLPSVGDSPSSETETERPLAKSVAVGAA